jgi:hypothetical protein
MLSGRLDGTRVIELVIAYVRFDMLQTRGPLDNAGNQQ